MWCCWAGDDGLSVDGNFRRRKCVFFFVGVFIFVIFNERLVKDYWFKKMDEKDIWFLWLDFKICGFSDIEFIYKRKLRVIFFLLCNFK